MNVNRILVLVGAVVAGLVVGLTLLTVTRSGRPSPAAPPAETSAPASAAREEAAAAAPPAAPAARAPAPPARRPAAEAPAPAAPPPAEAAPELGTLTIDSDVPGAQVFIDRRFIGAAPATARDLTPGTHQLNVSAEGFEGIARSIDVEPGPRELTVRFREVRLDASAAVVHKHRIGSCTGRLVASAAGVRYETSHAEDGFTVGLADLELFRVDYQERNLRVKVRKGREYNFTDPDGNADRLFVFHRDVESARARLAKGDQPAGN